MSTIRSLTTVAIAVALAACSQELTTSEPHTALVPEGDDAPVTTGADVYTLERTSTGWSGEIDFGFTNETERTISLLNCNGSYGLMLEKQQDDTWVTAWAPILPACLSPPIEIESDSARSDEIRIFAGLTGSNYYPQFSVEAIPGVYRLLISSAYWNYDHDGPAWGDLVPLEHRVSNNFEIQTDN